MATSTRPVAEAKALARRVPEDVVTEGRLDLLEEICTPDVIDHGPGGAIRGIDAVRQSMAALTDSFSDFSAAVEDVFGEGDRVAMRVTLRGTHDGPFMGLAPTGNSFEVPNLVITRIEDDRIAERWVLPDGVGLLRQLGAVTLPDELPI